MTREQLADLYDATAQAWKPLGVTKSVFINNMDAKQEYEDAVRQPKILFEVALAMSEQQEVRDAQRVYDETLAQLNRVNPKHPRPMSEIEREGRDAKSIYDAAILAAGDERVIEAKRLYEEAVRVASDAFAKKLR